MLKRDGHVHSPFVRTDQKDEFRYYIEELCKKRLPIRILHRACAASAFIHGSDPGERQRHADLRAGPLY